MFELLNRGISTLIILLVVAVAGTGILAYQYLWQPEPITSPNKTPQVQSPTDETAGWQTYENEEHRLAMKYPKEWGFLTLKSVKNNEIYIFDCSNERIDQIFYLESREIFAFIEEGRQYNNSYTFINEGRGYEQIIKILYPDKTIEKVYSSYDEDKGNSLPSLGRIRDIYLLPNEKYLAFKKTFFEGSKSYVTNTETGLNILENQPEEILFSPYDDLYLSQDNQVLVIRSYSDVFTTIGTNGLFVSDYGNLEKLNEVFEFVSEFPVFDTKIDQIYFIDDENLSFILKSENEETFYQYSIKTKELKEVEFTNWKTYRNEEYGFEIKHPSEWSNPEISGRTVSWYITPFFSFKIFNGIPNNESTFNEDPGLINDLEKWVEVGDWQRGGGVWRTFIDWLTIGNYKAVKAEVNWTHANQTHVYIGKDGVLYDIWLTSSIPFDEATDEEREKYIKDKANEKKYEEIFNQMLSTFKFIEEEEYATALLFCLEKYKEHELVLEVLRIEPYLQSASFLNFDSDEDKEIISLCWNGEYSGKEGILFVLDKQNNQWKSVWEKEGGIDQRYFTFENLRINDVDNDGIDEIIYEERGWYGGGGNNYLHLYSPKYDEWFLRDSWWSWDLEKEEEITGTNFSPNLDLEEYKVFKEFLENYSIQ